jgi:DNA primase
VALTIPEEKLAEIRNAADIVEIVSETVQLRKTGRNFQGLCPFHSEKTPSFTVNPEKGIFYCFGCAAGGDVIAFVMKQGGLRFTEAVKLLADRCRIALPAADLSPEARRQLSERETLIAIHRQAAAFFQECLRAGGEGAKARDYLAARRLSAATLEAFGLGYAPNAWDRLAQHLQRQGFSAEKIVQAGLGGVRSGDRAGCYDRFRDRIIFPIHNLAGEVIAFGGRLMAGEGAKYLNSPETPLFSKGRTLYGLHRARPHCRRSGGVLVVEGYIDLLALQQEGFGHVVATLGTALSAAHVQTLRGMVGANGQIILVFDGDDAGIKAAERSIPVFQQGYAEACILTLGQGHDPDSFLAAYGREAFAALLPKAQGLIPFLIDAALRRHGMGVEGRIRAVDELLPRLASLSDPLARDLYLRQLADRLGIEERALRQRLRGLTGAPGRAAAVPVPAAPGAPPAGAERGFEERIVAVMLQHPEALAEVARRGTLALFQEGELRAFGEALLAEGPSRGDPTARIAERIAAPALRGRIMALAMGGEPWDPIGWIRLLDKFAHRHRLRNNSLVAQIVEAERNNDQELLLRLLRKQDALGRRGIKPRSPPAGTADRGSREAAG